MDDWVDPRQSFGKRKSLLRAEYNALGKSNLVAINRIVSSKYRRGTAFNRQHPFVDVLLSDITESGEVLDLSELKRETEVASGFERDLGGCDHDQIPCLVRSGSENSIRFHRGRGRIFRFHVLLLTGLHP